MSEITKRSCDGCGKPVTNAHLGVFTIALKYPEDNTIVGKSDCCSVSCIRRFALKIDKGLANLHGSAQESEAQIIPSDIKPNEMWVHNAGHGVPCIYTECAYFGRGKVGEHEPTNAEIEAQDDKPAKKKAAK